MGDGAGYVYVIGQTESADFPLTNAFRSTYLDGDAFLVKIADYSPATTSGTNQAPLVYRLFSSYGFGRNGGFDLNIFIPLYHVYDLQASTNLSNWNLVARFYPDNQGWFHYPDQAAPFIPQRFYRVIVGTNSGGKQ
jgi:hypothetical protein